MALFPNPFAGQTAQPGTPELPRVPWRSNPLVTSIGLGLLGGRNINEGLANAAAAAPAGMAAKSGMQQFMLAQQEREAQKAEQEARKAQLNEVIKNYPNIPEQLRPVFMAQPELFPQYAVQSTMPADPTDDIREYQKAVEQGFTGGFMDYMTAMKKAGATNVSVDNVGTIPQGMELVQDPQTGAKRLVPIPGGPADTSQKDAAKQEQDQRYGDVVLQDIRRAKEKVKNQSWYAPVTGAGGSVLSNLGGSAARDTAALIDTIKSSVAFDRLQAMRESSPTGGALGAVTENELRLLQATLGSLDQGQSQQQLADNLDRLETIYSGIMRKFAAYPNAGQMGFGGDATEGTGWTEIAPGVRIREVQ